MIRYPRGEPATLGRNVIEHLPGNELASPSVGKRNAVSGSLIGSSFYLPVPAVSALAELEEELEEAYGMEGFAAFVEGL